MYHATDLYDMSIWEVHFESAAGGGIGQLEEQLDIVEVERNEVQSVKGRAVARVTGPSIF